MCWDIIVTAEVFPYLGSIERIVSTAAARLSPSGCFGFSTETLPDAALAGEPFIVGPNRRFAHAGSYVRGGLEAASFEVLAMDDITVRLEQDDPVPRHLVLARLLG